MFHALYPAESNHLVDIETLAAADMHFFVARRDGEALGCGALWHRDPAMARSSASMCSPKRAASSSRSSSSRGSRTMRATRLAADQARDRHAAARALGLFAASGFIRCGAYADYPTDDPYSVFMEKRLG